MPPKMILLVWETDRIELFLIPATEPGTDDLHVAHGHFLGAVGSEVQENALVRVSDRICETLEYCQDKDIGTTWAQFKVDMSDGPITGLGGQLNTINEIVHCGCVP